MCGIAGILSFAGSAVRQHEISTLTGLLRHRGPDAVGAWFSKDQRVGLGHTRLSILDASPEAGQPMVARSGRHVIVFNGEIYNFIEIAELLRAKGYVFRTQSDTEVLLHAWHCWGQDMFHRLNGMWALAIYDTVTGVTLLCRDRFGVKPLYYYHHARRFIFASEVQAIDRLLEHQLSPDADYLQALSRFEISDRSYLSGVKALQPGFCMVVSSDGQITSSQWYWLNSVEVPPSLAEQAVVLKELMIDACRLRLRSDVPVATCLSGGIDSGSLVALLNEVPAGEGRFPGFNHRSFTAAFPGTDLDETEAARALAQMYRLELDVEVIGNPSPDELELALSACDGPMPTMAFYSIWKLYRHIRQQGISVTLDGIGPDEILGGYYLGFDALNGAWHDKKPLWFYDLYKTYAAMYPAASAWVRRDLRSLCSLRAESIKRPIKNILTSIGLRHKETMRRASVSPALPKWVPEQHIMRQNPLALALWRQFFVAPLPFFLSQYDRCSMASGVECRLPFMDYRIVEYLFSLPLDSRIGDGYTKRVLREAVKGVLPDIIRLNRRKTGFNSPFSDWLRGPLREWVLDISGSSSFIQSSYFDGAALFAELCHAESDDRNTMDERRIWPALHLTWWLNHRKVALAEYDRQ